MTYNIETINESALTKRAEQSAKEWVEDQTNHLWIKAKESNLWDDWQALIDRLEDMQDNDMQDFAHEEADSWDWVIYHHKALELCANVWSSTLEEAEESWIDCGGEAKGLYETACQIAYWIIYHAIIKACDNEIATTLELAEEMQESSKEG